MRSLVIWAACVAACLLGAAVAQESESPEPAAESVVSAADAAAQAAGPSDASDADVGSVDADGEALEPGLDGPLERTEFDRRGALEGDVSAETLIERIERHLDREREAGPAEPPAPEAVIELDVRSCVDLALRQNAQILQADEELRKAQAQVGVARSGFLPSVTGRYAITQSEYNTRRQGASMLSSLGGSGGFGGISITGDPLIDIPISMLIGLGTQSIQAALMPDLTPDDRLYSTDVSIRQVIYTGGQLTAALRASEYLSHSQEWRRDAVAAELEYVTKQAFYDALLSDALIRVAEESVRTFERSLSDARNMYEVGMISNFEVLRAQTELGLRKTEYVTAMNQRELALSALRRVLYLPQGTPLHLVSTFEWEPPTAQVQEHISYALENRPEVRALELAVQAARQDVRRVKAQYLPQVAASATYQNVDGAGTASPDGWTFSVGAEWELVAGGRRRYERIAADAQSKSLEHQLSDLERQVELDVTQAWISIQNAMAQVESERGNVDLAREGLRLAELRFQEGVGTQSEVLDAELALTGAETNLIQALREYAIANAALERATGSGWRARKADTAPAVGEPTPAGVRTDADSAQ